MASSSDDNGGGSSATPTPTSHHYTLSQTLASDGSPIRSLCTIPTGPPTSSFVGSPTCADGYQLLCGSYDGLLTSHTLLAASGYMVAQTVLQPNEEGGRHPHYVGAMLPIPAAGGSGSAGSSTFGEPLAGGYITGCRDGIIRVFGPDHAPLKELRGHANNVSSLAWLELAATSDGGSNSGGNNIPPLLLSGSWDGTARIWNLQTGSCLATLDNHENGVEVAGLPPVSPSGAGAADASSSAGGGGGGLIGRLVTTSAGIAQGNVISNHRVRIFAIGLPTLTSPVATAHLLHTVSNDHGGPIRSVAYDADTDSILTASNDGTVKIRDGGTAQCHTTLTHPATFTSSDGQPPMLLDVTCLGGGRYACTAEDGTCVLWYTQHNANDGAGEPQTLDHPSSVWTVRPLPNGDIVTGCQDGFLRIYTTAADRFAPPEEVAALADAVAASRTKKSSGPSPEEIAALPKWELCALTQGRSEGQVQMFNKDGVAIAAQWSAASGTWIEIGEVTGTNENAGTIDGVTYDHVFPIEIEDPATGGVRKLRIGYNNGENQFVVAQRFIDANELPQYHLAQIADYIRQRAGADAGPATLGMEAAPAAAAAAPAAPAAAEPMDIAPVPQPSAYSHLPVQGYKSFATGATEQGLGKIVAKAREFNSTFTTNLTTEEIGPTLDTLCQTLAETNRYHASKISDEEMAAVGKMVRHWDAERVFPALDLARLLAVHPDAATSRRETFWTEVVASSLTKCKEEVSGTAAIAVPMLTMRLCANCFKGGLGSIKAVTGQLLDVLQCAEDLASSTNKNVRLAVSTVILNAASYGVSNGGMDPESAKKILSVVGTIVGSSLYESEGVVRALVALGSTLLIPGAGGEAAKEEAKSLHFDSMVGHAANAHGDKAKGVADEICLILKS